VAWRGRAECDSRGAGDYLKGRCAAARADFGGVNDVTSALPAATGTASCLCPPASTATRAKGTLGHWPTLSSRHI